MGIALGGIDEAGRGPVIGPMVIAGVVIDEADSEKLRELGIKDSKLLSRDERERLFNVVKDIAKDFVIEKISPMEIDNAVESDTNNLNKLEAAVSASIIKRLKPQRVVLDSPSNNTSAYRQLIERLTEGLKIEVVAENKADLNHPVVSAASILAKVTRDREIEKLKRKYGVDFGSGYPSDPFTRAFLRENYSKYPFFRKSWSSWKNAAQKKNQRSLSFFKR